MTVTVIKQRATIRPASPLPAIYLAGKISKGDWRDSVVGSVDHGSGVTQYTQGVKVGAWPVLAGGVMGAFDYVGPFFIGDDHGCAHRGDHTHGMGDTCCGDDGRDHAEVKRLCLAAIDRADIVFAWLTWTRHEQYEQEYFDAYGTLCELGYAAAKGKTIWIATPEPWSRRWADLWFAFTLADVMIAATTPRDALMKLRGMGAANGR